MRGSDIVVLEPTYPQSSLVCLHSIYEIAKVLPMGCIRVGILDAFAMGYPDLDITSMLATNPKLQIMLEYLLIAIRSEWPKVRMPKQFQAMHGDMSGFFEIRMQDGKKNFRIFLKPVKLNGEYLLLIASGTKPRRAEFPSSLYLRVRALAAEFEASLNPLSLFEEIAEYRHPGPAEV